MWEAPEGKVVHSMSRSSIIGIFLAVVFGVFLIAPVTSLVNGTITGGEWMQHKWLTAIAQGGTMYVPSSGFVEGTTPAYAPVYYLLVGYFMKVLGISMLWGQLVSFISYLGSLVLVGLISYKLTGRFWIAVVGSFLVLLHPVLRDDSVVLRPDILALAFTLGGVYLIVRGQIWWSLPLFVLAVYTKQLYVAAPLAVCIYYLFKNWRLSISWGTVYTFSCLGVLIIGNILTGGEFVKHLIIYPMQSGPVMYTIQHASVALLLIIVPFLFALGYLVLHRSWGLVQTYFLVALVVMLLTIGKDGAGVNYSFEVVATTSILAVMFLEYLLGRVPKWRKLQVH